MTSAIVEIPLQTQQFLDVVEIEADDLVEVRILNDLEFSEAGTKLRHIKTQIARVGEERLAMTRPLDESKRRITGMFQPYLDKLEKASRAISAAMVAYNQELERKRIAAQAELDRIAKEKADREKEELAKSAEKALDDNKPELAVLYAEKAEKIIPKPIDAVKVSQPAGTAFTTRWTFEITDEKLIPHEFLIVDRVTLGKVVTAMKEKTNIPGVKAVPQTGVSSRRI